MSDDRKRFVVEHEGTETLIESIDVSQRDDVKYLRKHAVGLAGVLFLTVTGSAPISAMLFNTPISVGFGNGIGTPAGFLFATIILTIFSVGYVAMARKKTTAGGFYSFISHGLGRELGMATGLTSVLAYSVFEASLAGGFAFFLNDYLNKKFQLNIAWPWLALFMVALIGVLAFFDVRLSVRVLGVGLITEILILLIMDAVVFARGGKNGIPLSAINLANAFKGFPAQGKLLAGAAGIGLFYAFWSWVGFEMAPNYGEESRDPKRIVPLAMYISVIGLGIFYTLTSWAPIAGYANIHVAIKAAQTNPAEFYFGPTTALVGGWATEIMRVLIITGSFACGMAFHNTAARYFYSLGRERVLPTVLGKTHDKYASPHVASIVQSLIAAGIVIGFAVFAGSNDPTTQAYIQLYGLMAVMGVIIILAVQALVSLAILVYFAREHRGEVHWWKTVVAPVISFIAQVWVLWLLLKNILFLGTGYTYSKALAPIDLAVFIVGLGYALYLKNANKKKYGAIGRMIHEGL